VAAASSILLLDEGRKFGGRAGLRLRNAIATKR
jgi:hypothetical protein